MLHLQQALVVEKDKGGVIDTQMPIYRLTERPEGAVACPKAALCLK